ncbi:MAG: twin-arginine translocase TatA/TatE family subunit [Opitutaceae bacterium]
MNPLAFIQNISLTDLVLVVCVILLFVGAKRLPDLIRSIGQSCREFKGAAHSEPMPDKSKDV